MKTQNIFIAHPKTEEQINVLKAIAKAFKMKFEVSEENPYDPEFVDKILQGDKDLEEGKGKKITINELNSLCK